ncbi:MAG TPA: dienelactone hydrolase family protein [Acidimicrobiales bacterium]|jgi:dienelactone hydrolase|nr:dienelactone hydrolase family protein [Acidimicrobiales bacterium]
MADTLGDFEKEPFSSGGITHDIYRKGSGPAVIVCSEVPGITPHVADFARKVADRGLTAVMPHLFGTPGKEMNPLYAMDTMVKLCISKEFSGLALGRTGPIMNWLRALARAEHERCGGPGVGAVGMCYTGGFALAMAVDDTVLAPVLSQPSLPFGVGRARKADIQLSEADWQKVQARVRDEDLCVIGLRFTGDSFVPEERFRHLKEKLGDGFIAVELDSSPGNPHGHPKNAHSVLTEHLQDREGTPTRAALDQVLSFFQERLS